MEQHQEVFLSIVKSAIYDVIDDEQDYTQVDWESINKLAAKNKLVPVLNKTICELAGKYPIPEALINRWKQQTMRCSISEYRKYFSLRRVLEEAKKVNIKMVLIKGCVLADLYPEYALRSSSDTDIFVYEKDKEKAILLLERLGYIRNEQHSKVQVPVYVLAESQHIIELHFCLWEDYEGPQMEKLNKLGLTAEEKLVTIKACGMEITTLGHEEHLIYQIFHMVKHFIIEGIEFRYLTDITLFINRYEKEIDFNRFWKKIKQLGYETFCIQFLSICVSYLHMSKAILQGREEERENISEMLLLDLVSGGKIFEDKTSSWQIMGIMAPYLLGDQEVPEQKLERKIKILFPSRRSLAQEFNYAKKHGVLLPIAWGHRFINFIIRKSKYKKQVYGADEKLKVAEHRLLLVKQLDLSSREKLGVLKERQK